MTDFKTEMSGDWEIWLNCPECDFEGLVYYRTQPPLYCSPACKQRAYRRRKAKRSPEAKLMRRQWQELGFTGEDIIALEKILDRWGIEAAQAASDLAIAIVRRDRDKRGRF